jgi:hypothetical protein
MADSLCRRARGDALVAPNRRRRRRTQNPGRLLCTQLARRAAAAPEDARWVCIGLRKKRRLELISPLATLKSTRSTTATSSSGTTRTATLQTGSALSYGSTVDRVVPPWTVP